MKSLLSLNLLNLNAIKPQSLHKHFSVEVSAEENKDEQGLEEGHDSGCHVDPAVKYAPPFKKLRVVSTTEKHGLQPVRRAAKGKSFRA